MSLYSTTFCGTVLCCVSFSSALYCCVVVALTCLTPYFGCATLYCSLLYCTLLSFPILLLSLFSAHCIHRHAHMHTRMQPVSCVSSDQLFGLMSCPLTSCAMPCYAMLCHAMLCHDMTCHAMPCYAMPCYAILCYAMPCHAMLCHAMPCHAMLCHAMLCHDMLSLSIALTFIRKYKNNFTFYNNLCKKYIVQLYVSSTLPFLPSFPRPER